MFRLRLSTTNAGVRTRPSTAGNPPGKLFLIGIVTLVVLWVLSGWLFGRQGPEQTILEPDSAPVVLAIQRIGQLHTVAMPMKDVLREESEAAPQGMAATLPGASSIYHWATHNQALVVAEGTVEAGIDLSQLTPKDVTTSRGADGKSLVRVHLPPVTIYRPTVRVRVENNQPGPFWRDENIVPKAQQDAEQRFTEAAEKAGIRQQARNNAIQKLNEMRHLFGDREVEFTF